MKAASTELRDLLTSGGFVRADLYTFTLIGGAVYRYSGTDRPISFGGNIFNLGIKISDGGIKAKIGVEVDPVDITIKASEADILAGTDFLKAIRANALDGAAIRIDRVFAPTWYDMAASGPTGGYLRFSGRFSAIADLSRAGATIQAAPWTELLNVNVPADVYQANCLNTVFDTLCGLTRATYEVTGTVESGSTVVLINSALTNPAGYFSLGKIVFTSGALNGVQRTVKSSDGSGNFTLVNPLPAVPAAGVTFKAYPGCDGTENTCISKFNNKLRFRGYPFVPPPEQSI